jgi:hypothetical protein
MILDLHQDSLYSPPLAEDFGFVRVASCGCSAQIRPHLLVQWLDSAGALHAACTRSVTLKPKRPIHNPPSLP